MATINSIQQIIVKRGIKPNFTT